MFFHVLWGEKKENLFSRLEKCDLSIAQLPGSPPPGSADGIPLAVSIGAPREALGVCCASGAAIPAVFHPFNPINYCCSSNKKPEACNWNERSFQTTNMNVSI